MVISTCALRAGHHIQHRVALVVPLSPDAEGLAPAEDHIDGQAMEPGAEGGLAAEGAELLPRPDEDVLRDLVGFLIAQHPADQAVDPCDVRAIEPLERAGIAAGGQRRIHRIRIGPSGLHLRAALQLRELMVSSRGIGCREGGKGWNGRAMRSAVPYWPGPL